MDDITWSWFYASWLEKREEKTKFAKSLGCFIGSFFNPAAAKEISEVEKCLRMIRKNDIESINRCEVCETCGVK